MIFISYRRSDDSAAAGRLSMMLEAEFGRNSVFLDTQDIQPGTSFPEVIRDALNRCPIVLAVIGPTWLSAKDEAHRRRIDDPADWVRTEISIALRSPKHKLIPVLIGSHRIPAAEDLNNDLCELADRQAWRLSHDSWESDVNALIIELRTISDGLLDDRRKSLDQTDIRFLKAITASSISNKVGSKYLPSLYVSREGVEGELDKHAEGVTSTVSVANFRAMVRSFRHSVTRIASRYVSEMYSEAVNALSAECMGMAATVDAYLDKFTANALSMQDHAIWRTKVQAHVRMVDDAIKGVHAVGDKHNRNRSPSRRVDELSRETTGLAKLATSVEDRVNAVERAARPLYMLVEKAGRGKTNLLCDFALRSAESRPTIFLAAKTIDADENGLRDAVASVLEAIPDSDVTDVDDLARRMGRRQTLIICIDGINEYPEPVEFRHQLRRFMKAAKFDNVRIVASCREEYWSLFERDLSSFLSVAVSQLSREVRRSAVRARS